MEGVSDMATKKKPATKAAPKTGSAAEYVVLKPFYDKNQKGRLYKKDEKYNHAGMTNEWIDRLLKFDGGLIKKK